MRLQLRRATPEDELVLFEWANDPATRANAFNSKPIQLSDHKAWYARSLNDSGGCEIYVATGDGPTPIGQVRFNKGESDRWEIDYSVGAGYRGGRLGEQMLSAAIELFTRDKQRVELIGRVKVENTPSCRIFENLGFQSAYDKPAGVVIYIKHCN